MMSVAIHLSPWDKREPLGRVQQRFSPAPGSSFPLFPNKYICSAHWPPAFAYSPMHKMFSEILHLSSYLSSPLLGARGHKEVNREVTDSAWGWWLWWLLFIQNPSQERREHSQTTSICGGEEWQPGSHTSCRAVNRVGAVSKGRPGQAATPRMCASATHCFPGDHVVLAPLYSLFKFQIHQRTHSGWGQRPPDLTVFRNVLKAHWETCFPKLAIPQSNQIDRLPISGPEQHSCLH